MGGKRKRLRRKHYDWHHRKPSSIGGGDSNRNMSHVSISKHRAWHTLFVNFTPQQIADIINETWLDPDWQFTLERRQTHESE